MIKKISLCELQQQQTKSKNHKKSMPSICKISSIRDRLRKAVLNYPQKCSHEQNQNQTVVQSYIHSQSIDQKKLSFVRSQSPNKTRQYQNRKTLEGFNKNFNHTKTDWLHNFTGNKYIQKIKQEVRTTKYSSFYKNKIKIKQKSVSIIRQNNQKLLNQQNQLQRNNILTIHYKRGLSEQQLKRINQIRENRRAKINNYQSFKQIKRPYKKEMVLQVRKSIMEQEKYLPITPWDNQIQSSLSNVWIK